MDVFASPPNSLIIGVGKQIKRYLYTNKISYISDLVSKMYPNLDKRLIKAAGRSVLAHLLHMQELGYVKSSDSGWVLR